MWRIRLDQPPRYDREAFSETANAITVYGNIVAANQGETQAEAIIGNGDARAIFQTFALPKAPLTYLLHGEATPPHAPELEVFVDGRDVVAGSTRSSTRARRTASTSCARTMRERASCSSATA